MKKVKKKNINCTIASDGFSHMAVEFGEYVNLEGKGNWSSITLARMCYLVKPFSPVLVNCNKKLFFIFLLLFAGQNDQSLKSLRDTFMPKEKFYAEMCTFYLRLIYAQESRKNMYWRRIVISSFLTNNNIAKIDLSLHISL